jgi:hypothetical protein
LTKSKKWSRVPTPDDLANFSGVHCAAKWKKARDMNWRCPSCGRDAHQIVRWSYINGTTMRRLYGDEHGMGWTTAIVTHHCHSDRRFHSVLLCGDCNSADGAAKRKLKLPADWSFSPDEIGQFATVTPYSGKTTIDFETAQMIYDEMTRSHL